MNSPENDVLIEAGFSCGCYCHKNGNTGFCQTCGCGNLEELLPNIFSSIKVMPDKLTLEAFLLGSHGAVLVYFDRNRGEFVWHNENDKKLLQEFLSLGQPKTEFGRQLQNMR